MVLIRLCQEDRRFPEGDPVRYASLLLVYYHPDCGAATPGQFRPRPLFKASVFLPLDITRYYVNRQ